MTVALFGNVKLSLVLAAGVLLGLLTIALLAATPGRAVNVGLAGTHPSSVTRPFGVLWH